MEVTFYLESTTDNLYPALFQCFTIILCGYIAGRFHVVSQTEAKGIGTFVGTFALPSLIFLSLARLDFSVVNWRFLLAILLAKGIVFFAVISVTLLISKTSHLGRAGIFAIFCTQSNDFALGYPIISAIYETSHPEYAAYLYLMAPISLAILNPVAFVLMEISKQRENLPATTNIAERYYAIRLNMVRQVLKGIVFNPVLFMTILGILGNIAFSHNLPKYIEGLLDVLGQAFSGSALFLLGLRMVGQFYRLRGPALVLPFVLIMVKLIILPVVMRESVSALHAGINDTETQSLSTYAFLYGTIPTAPAVFVFSNQYQLEIDLMASSMVICTFLSAPMMFMSAQMISITKDYADQLMKFGFDLSILSLVASLWVLLVFIITKKYKRMPHRLTLCLIASQIVLAISVIWGGPKPEFNPSWTTVVQQAIRIFSMFSCALWIAMLAMGMLLLQSRGPCFVVTLWPVLGFVAWGAPAVMVSVLLATKAKNGNLEDNSTNAIRLCVLVFSLTVCTGSLIAYLRFRRRSAQIASLAADVASPGPSPPDESSVLVDNAEPMSQSQSVSINGCYGAITATPSPSKSVNGCCSNDPNCDNGLQHSHDIEDMPNVVRECNCPPHKACSNGTCPYVTELERVASSMGLLPAESVGRGAQLLRHTVLILVYSLSMFIGVTYTMWSMVQGDNVGIFIEIELLDIVACYGQGLVTFVLFGLDCEEVVIPAARYIQKKLYGVDTVVLTPIDDLSFETKHVCEQFITHHLTRCKAAISRDTRSRMRTYRGVFRGACLVRWLIDCGLAKDEHEAVQYGRHLLEGRLIAHVNNTHHFSNSQLLYIFK